jgi:F420-dependent oxidoreductase-like protein
MKIGLWIDDEGRTVEEVGADAKAAEDAGLDRIWFSQRDSWDALTLITAVAAYTTRIPHAVGVVPVYPRHPLALAAQALSVQAVTGNRLTLGLGASHPHVVEGAMGQSMDRPAAYLREYVAALGPLLTGEASDHAGERVTARGQIQVPGAAAPDLVLAALGPRMLKIAGELTAGTAVNWVGPELIEDFVRPTIDRAAAAAGRPQPEVIAGVCVALTDDPDATRQWIGDKFGMAAQLPAYRAVLDRGGKAGIEDTAVLGDEEAVAKELQRFREVGTTEFLFVPVGTPEEQQRTIRFARDYAAASAQP